MAQKQRDLIISQLQGVKFKAIYEELLSEIKSRPVCETVFAAKYGIQPEDWIQIYAAIYLYNLNKIERLHV